jgi:hypothetical protein
MTTRVVKRKRSETVEQTYNRLNRRIVRRLPVTAAETTFVWREKSRRMMSERTPA